MKAAAKLNARDNDWFSELPEQLEEAASTYPLPETGDWDTLAELSAVTRYEGIEVHSDSIIRERGQLVAPATIFVELIYDPNSSDPVSFHDSYPARVFFAADKEAKTVEVKRIEVDTSSFYE